jgi:SAM-dependent methyltransferase
MKWFRGSASNPKEGTEISPPRGTRRSSGMGQVWNTLSSQEGLCVLDLGSTSASNIRLLTEMGHRIYSEDLLVASSDPSLVSQDEYGQRVFDSNRFLTENLSYLPGQFDCVLAWSFADYMEEPLVKPVMERLWTVMKPGGVLLAFFHMKDAGPDAPCYRYHLTAGDMLETQVLTAGKAGGFKLQRVFNNRHIEGLFRDFSSIKFFLARDNIREALVVR